jgi:hypothetical protein
LWIDSFRKYREGELQALYIYIYIYIYIYTEEEVMSKIFQEQSVKLGRGLNWLSTWFHK